MLKTGYFLTVEGVDGAGKSTQVGRLATLLAEHGYRTVTTREPGGTPLGLEIRRILLDPALTLTPEAELLLFLADRSEHVRRLIKPSLSHGAIVLCDRFSDSTLAYQGYGWQTDVARIRRWDAEIRDWIAPDLTLLLDCPIDQAARTRGPHQDRYQRLDSGFHQRVRDGFLALAAAEPGRMHRIDASQDVEVVHAAVARITLCWLAERAKP